MSELLDEAPMLAPPELERPWAELGHFVFFDADGRIHSIAHMQVILVQQQAQNLGLSFARVPQPVSLEENYVSAGDVTARPDCPATLEGSQLTGLPVPSVITINGVAYPCGDETAELEFDQPGSYQVVVSAWPYLDKEFTIENPPQ